MSNAKFTIMNAQVGKTRREENFTGSHKGLEAMHEGHKAAQLLKRIILNVEQRM